MVEEGKATFRGETESRQDCNSEVFIFKQTLQMINIIVGIPNIEENSCGQNFLLRRYNESAKNDYQCHCCRVSIFIKKINSSYTKVIQNAVPSYN